MLTRARLATAAIAVAAAAGSARGERVIAVAPFSTMGAEDTSTGTKQVLAELEAAIAALPDTRVVRASQVADAIKKARRPQLRACEGEAACLGELAGLVGAQLVVSGEVGGLGESKVVYLAAIEAAGGGKELRSTTLAVGAADDGAGARGAVVRLLDPDSYRGALRLAIDAAGATVYVNGTKVTPSARGELALPVGTHAVRVTHPEYHDFVRFIDVEYGKPVEVTVGLQQYPIARGELAGAARAAGGVEYVDPPLWRRWYVVGPAAIGVAVLTGFVVAHLVHDFPAADCHKVGGGAC